MGDAFLIQNIKSGFILGTQENPAESASAIKEQNSNAENGVYWYTLPSGVKELYTDFETFSNYPFVMVNRLSNQDNLQYLTTEQHVVDLKIIPQNLVQPTRSAKLSDSDINHIIVPNGIRYVVVAQHSNFFRLTGNTWTSNFGQSASCSYSLNSMDRYATPSNNPNWLTPTSSIGCGGMNHGSWTVLSGIHTNDNGYMGGYTGSSSSRATPPSSYISQNAGNDTWGPGGYVFINW